MLVTCSRTAFVFCFLFLVWLEEKRQVALCSLTSTVVSFAFVKKMNQECLICSFSVILQTSGLKPDVILRWRAIPLLMPLAWSPVALVLGHEEIESREEFVFLV